MTHPSKASPRVRADFISRMLLMPGKTGWYQWHKMVGIALMVFTCVFGQDKHKVPAESMPYVLQPEYAVNQI